MITVGPLTPEDRPAWEALFRGYNAFYDRVLPQPEMIRTWQEIQKDIVLHGLAAKIDGQVVGIAHYLTHASTTSADVCYLQDLFSSPEVRGQGVGRALIERVYIAAAQAASPRVYWLTHETNKPGMALYDKVAERSGFIQYRKQIS